MQTIKVNPCYLNSDLNAIKEAKFLLKNLLIPKERGEDINSRYEDVLSLLEELEEDLEALNMSPAIRQIIEDHFGHFPDYEVVRVPANLFKHAGEQLAVLPEFPPGSDEGIACIGHYNVRQIFLTRLLCGPTAKVFEKIDLASKAHFVLADFNEEKLYQVDW
jgi:hypothetical protein